MAQHDEKTANKVQKELKSLKASPDLHQKMKMESAKTGKKIEELVVEAWGFYTKAQSSPKGLADSSTVPTSKTSAHSTGPVVEIVRRHSQDPSFLECIVALDHIWNVGDRDYQEAIVSNCRAFVRASDAVRMLREGTKREGSHFTERVGELLATAAATDPRTLAIKEALADSRASRKGVDPVGGGHARKSKGGS